MSSFIHIAKLFLVNIFVIFVVCGGIIQPNQPECLNSSQSLMQLIQQCNVNQTVNCICQNNILQAYDSFGVDCGTYLNQNFSVVINPLHDCCSMNNSICNIPDIPYLSTTTTTTTTTTNSASVTSVTTIITIVPTTDTISTISTISTTDTISTTTIFTSTPTTTTTMSTKFTSTSRFTSTPTSYTITTTIPTNSGFKIKSGSILFLILSTVFEYIFN